jgi:crotonobetainyl-CoA:carnitine CoA-transferase CaiB-like acyl-CoA transferase
VVDRRSARESALSSEVATIAPPLSAIRALEVGSRIGSGFAGRLLVDLGADVTFIEESPSEGSEVSKSANLRMRDHRPGLFGYLHAGKRSKIFDTDLAALVAAPDYDIVIYGAPDQPDSDVEALLEVIATSSDGPKVVHISPFGRSGPYCEFSANEFVAAAFSGVTERIGLPGRAPLTLPLSQAGFQAGYAAAIGAIAALMITGRRGASSIVEVAEYEVLATAHAGYGATRYHRAGIREKRSGNRMAHLPYPQTVLPCADGFVELSTPENRQWVQLISLLGNPDWASDPRFKSRMRNSQADLAEELDSYFVDWLKGKTKEEFFRECLEFGVPSGPVRTVDEILADKQLASRGFFRTFTFPSGEKVRVPGPGFGTVGRKCDLDFRVPRPGEDARPQVNAQSANQQQAGASHSAEGPQDLPLSGVRVLDLGWVWAGAIPGQILADLGAEVIKVESLKRIDYMRLGKPLVGEIPDPEQNPWFHTVNRNKKSISVNLQTEEGVGLLKALAKKCDLVIENFKPGFLQKVGLDFRSLTKENGSLVMVSMSGVGQDGPFHQIPAYAPLLSGLSGLDSLVGYPSETLQGIQQPYADTNAGVTAAFAAISALYELRQTGKGKHIDLAETEAAIAVIGEAFVDLQLVGIAAQPMGNWAVGFAPQGHYPTTGEDAWIAIALTPADDWPKFCQILEADIDLAQGRFASPEGRLAARGELDEILARYTSRFSRADLLQKLQGAGIRAAPVIFAEDMLADEHYVERETFVALEHPVLGEEQIYGPIFRMAGYDLGPRKAAPMLGQHTAEIFSDMLGLSSSEIEDLIEREVLV